MKRNKTLLHGFLTLGLLSCALSSPNILAEGVVNVYSYRQTQLIQPLLDGFSKQTGIKTQAVYLKAGIAERMELEGTKSPVDVILTVDVYRLAELTSKGLTQPVNSAVINKQVPADLRDPNNHWFGLTKRARVIYASDDPTRAPLNEVRSYRDLAKAKLGKRLCIRPLSHIYNLGLTASLIAQNGEPATAAWLQSIKENLARKPQGNDRAQIKGITQGVCDYAVANSYYFALLAEEDPKWTRNIRVITPKLSRGGTHINISGMALARYAPNQANAQKLMEFLVGQWAQEYYASVNNEFPIVAETPITPFLVNTFGDFETQQLSLSAVSSFAPTAQKLVNQAGIDH